MRFVLVRLVGLVLCLVAVCGVLVSVVTSLLAAVIAPESRYARNQLIAHDQAVNSALGGDPDETISSRAAKRKWAPLCRFLDWLSPGHCSRSIERDEGKRAVIE